MKCINHINDVKDIFIVNDQLLYIINNIIFIKDKTFEIGDSEYLFVQNNNLFKTNYSEKRIYILRHNEFIVFDNNCWTSINYNSDEDYVLMNNSWTTTTIKTCNFKFEANGLQHILFSKDDFLITHDYWNNNKITSFHSRREPLWDYTPPAFFTINRYPIVIEDILFSIAHDQHGYNQLMVGLGIENGNILWEDRREITQKNRSLVSYTFNKKNNLLYKFGQSYEIFNPKTGKIIYEKDFEETIKHDLVPHINSIYDNKLWFVSSNYENSEYERVKFGYINLDTHRLEFIQDFYRQQGELSFAPPIYHEGKLYLRGTSYHNLYIFE